MESRVLPIDENKESTSKTQSRVFPLKILKLLVIFLVLGLGFSILNMYMTRPFRVQPDAPTAHTVIQPSIEEPYNLDRWIKPPSSLIHTMNDTELFWRASFVPQIKKYPFRRVPKVAFMFLTRGPLPLSPLWERFFKGHQGLYSIYIHSLPSYRAKFPPKSVFYQRQIPSQVSEWGRMSMCDAEKRLLANALLDISNERFILLSESCIPLSNFTTIYKYLMGSRHSFVGAFDDPGPHGRGRYNENMAPEVNVTQWRKGAQWFEVNRELAITLVKDVTYYPIFKEFCRPACYVDEHYFPTMLAIEAPHRLANRTITWVDWSRGGPHPATFGKGDITEPFLKKILESHTCLYNNRTTSFCFLFARKFAPSTLEPLLRLSGTVFGF